jgi:endoribonuclease Dicer
MRLTYPIPVVVHDVILASAIDSAATRAARRASLSALDALEGDAQFLTRTCDCRTGTRKATAQNKEVDVSLSCLGDGMDTSAGPD